MKKLDLVSDHCLVGRPVADVEVIDAWIDADLTFRCSARCVNCRLRLGDLIIRGDANQPGTVKRGGMLDRMQDPTAKPLRRGSAIVIPHRYDATPADPAPGALINAAS
jgi:hypothetical protein